MKFYIRAIYFITVAVINTCYAHKYGYGGSSGATAYAGASAGSFGGSGSGDYDQGANFLKEIQKGVGGIAAAVQAGLSNIPSYANYGNPGAFYGGYGGGDTKNCPVCSIMTSGYPGTSGSGTVSVGTGVQPPHGGYGGGGGGYGAGVSCSGADCISVPQTSGGAFGFSGGAGCKTGDCLDLPKSSGGGSDGYFKGVYAACVDGKCFHKEFSSPGKRSDHYDGPFPGPDGSIHDFKLAVNVGGDAQSGEKHGYGSSVQDSYSPPAAGIPDYYPFKKYDTTGPGHTIPSKHYGGGGIGCTGDVCGPNTPSGSFPSTGQDKPYGSNGGTPSKHYGGGGIGCTGGGCGPNTPLGSGGSTISISGGYGGTTGTITPSKHYGGGGIGCMGGGCGSNTPSGSTASTGQDKSYGRGDSTIFISGGYGGTTGTITPSKNYGGGGIGCTGDSCGPNPTSTGQDKPYVSGGSTISLSGGYGGTAGHVTPSKHYGGGGIGCTEERCGPNTPLGVQTSTGPYNPGSGSSTTSITDGYNSDSLKPGSFGSGGGGVICKGTDCLSSGSPSQPASSGSGYGSSGTISFGGGGGGGVLCKGIDCLTPLIPPNPSPSKPVYQGSGSGAMCKASECLDSPKTSGSGNYGSGRGYQNQEAFKTHGDAGDYGQIVFMDVEEPGSYHHQGYGGIGKGIGGHLTFSDSGGNDGECCKGDGYGSAGTKSHASSSSYASASASASASAYARSL